ncbi:alpha/beta hydrolase [Pseudoluteimonas lycopersici]|nr:alpha/beta hydrolase [Lysobacter lycopersici]
MTSLRSKLVFLLLAMFASSAGIAGNRQGPTPVPPQTPTSPGGGGMSQLPSSFCNPASGYQNPLPANMCFRLNVAYGSDPLQKLDVYMPAAGAHDAPVILMVHGGAWYQGDKLDNSVVRNKAVKWVPPGAIFISVNYPLVPKVTPLQQARSVALALAYAQKHATEWGGDPDKFVLMGFSAGGHLVSLLAAQPALLKSNSQKVRPWLGTIALDAAVYDVPATMNNPSHDPVFDQAFGTNVNLWNAASPLLQMHGRMAPFLAVCSTEESGSCTRAQAFVDKALGYGTDALVIDESLDHEHINANLGLASDYTTQVNSFLTGLVNGTLQ